MSAAERSTGAEGGNSGRREWPGTYARRSPCSGGGQMGGIWETFNVV